MASHCSPGGFELIGESERVAEKVLKIASASYGPF